MDARLIVQQALDAGIALYLKDGQLAYKTRKGGFPDALKALVRAARPQIERYLADMPAANEGALPAPVARGRAKAVLSFAQERLWAIDCLAGGSPYYNLPFAIELRGQVCAEWIARAVAAIVTRHEILRTNYVEEDGAILQVVRADCGVPFDVVDLAHLPAATQQAELALLRAAEAAHVFDLGRDVLLRSRLVRLSGDVHVLLTNMHHIAADGWSIGILIREFSRTYAACSQGAQDLPPPLPLQYSDYAAWQREHLSGPVLDRQLAYWLPVLDGLPQLHDLRTDRPRPPLFSYRGAALESRVEGALVDRLQTLAHGANATLFVVMQAAMAVLLHRYSGAQRIVIGTAVANREQAEIAGLIGCFINMLVFKHELDPAMPFGELLGQVRERVLNGMSHQQVPFEMLVERLRPARTLSHSPLFQVAMVYQNNASEAFSLPGVDIRLLEQPVAAVKYDLTTVFKESDTGLRVSWEYASDLFDAQTIGRMAANFSVLLGAIADAAATPIGQLALLTDTEIRQHRDGARSQVALESLPALFEAQVRAHPARVAVTCAGNSLTFDELNRRANRLAHWLCACGIGDGALVGVCIERSLDMMVCLLGILKSGAAYVPLDPGYPAARLAHMVENSGLRLVLTQAPLQSLLPPGDAEWVCVDALAAELAHRPDHDPSAPDAGQRAYVIYTSGSTGLPKGVAVTHGNVGNFLCSMQREPGFTADDRLLAVTPISFDIHVLELFVPLVAGGTVVIATRDVAGDGPQLLQALAEERITVMQATPATWRLLLATQQWAGDGTLKVLCGGEAMDRALAGQLLQRSGAVWNMYGPTETTVWSSCARIVADEEPITIGLPVANTGVYVLDAQRQLQPAGAIGEIYIGGAGVAQGYLGREDLTAERFVADPFAGEAAARMYRTGDFGYRLADGRVVYCGRADGQVKVRGFRIELEEIEHQLQQCAHVDAAVVIGDGAGEERRLVAYVVPAQAAAGDWEPAVRSQLRRHLPEYMVPAVFVALERLPLTPNGKVDRKALVAPAAPAPAALVPADTDTEREVARIWSEFLRLSGISMTSNFFEIGGHSLLGARMVTALNQRFGCTLHLKDLFEAKTARDLALHIDFLTAVRLQESVARASEAGNYTEEAEW